MRIQPLIITLCSVTKMTIILLIMLPLGSLFVPSSSTPLLPMMMLNCPSSSSSHSLMDFEKEMNIASNNQDLDRIKLLYSVSGSMKVYEPYYDENTLLHVAARQGNMKIALWIHSQEPGFEFISGKQGKDLLWIMTSRGDLEMLKWWKSVCPLEAPGTRSYSSEPLPIPDFTKEINTNNNNNNTEKGALKDFLKTKGWIPPRWWDYLEVMYTACYHGHMHIIEWVYSMNPHVIDKPHPDLYIPNGRNRTMNLMQVAIKSRNIKLMKWLHERDPVLLSSGYENKLLLFLDIIEEEYSYSDDDDDDEELSLLKSFEMMEWVYSNIPGGLLSSELPINPREINKNNNKNNNSNSDLLNTVLSLVERRLKFLQWFYHKNPQVVRGFISKERVAIFASENHDLELLKWIYSLRSSYLLDTNEEGYNSIHIAAKMSFKCILEWIYHRDRNLLLERGPNGVNLAHISRGSKRSVVRWIQNNVPLFLETSDDRGNLPTMLHKRLPNNITVVVSTTKSKVSPSKRRKIKS